MPRAAILGRQTTGYLSQDHLHSSSEQLNNATLSSLTPPVRSDGGETPGWTPAIAHTLRDERGRAAVVGRKIQGVQLF